MRICIVEDEPIIRRELKVLLENAMYQVTVLETFESVAEQIEKSVSDLVLLDVNLPKLSGFDVCTQLRETMEVPIIFLTSRTDSMDELTGILKGGDDYITKPYQPPILLARIAAVLKRTKGLEKGGMTHYVYQGVELDLAKCCLTFQNSQVELTKTEMKILHLLFQHVGESYFY